MRKILLITLFISICFHFTNYSQQFNPSFFVFEDGLWNANSKAPEYWAQLVKDAGFDGVELIGHDKVDAMLPELKKQNLKLFTLYIHIDTTKEEFVNDAEANAMRSREECDPWKLEKLIG